MIFLSTAGPATGQEVRQLTLEQAWELASENSPAYRRSRNAVASAEAASAGSLAAFIPDLRLNLSSGGSLSRTFTGQDEFGQPVRRDDPLEYSGSSSSQSIGIGLPPLFDGGVRYRQLRAARANEEAARAAAETERATNRAEIARRYFRAKHLAELITVQEELLRSAEARLVATERLLRVAVASPIDQLGAEIDLARQRSALEQARGEARKAMLLLSEVMGVSEPSWQLSSELPTVFDPRSLNTEWIVERTLATSPRMSQVEALLGAAEQRQRAAGATRWPTVSASIGASRGIGARGSEALFDFNPPNQSFSFGLGVSIPIFNPQARTTLAQARLSVLDAAESRRAVRLSVEREVRTAFIDLENVHRVVQLAEQSRDLERRRLELANERYRLGGVRFTELQTIIDGAASAERAALDARYAFANALISLEQLAGPIAPAERY